MLNVCYQSALFPILNNLSTSLRDNSAIFLYICVLVNDATKLDLHFSKASIVRVLAISGVNPIMTESPRTWTPLAPALLSTSDCIRENFVLQNPGRISSIFWFSRMH